MNMMIEEEQPNIKKVIKWLSLKVIKTAETDGSFVVVLQYILIYCWLLVS